MPPLASINSKHIMIIYGQLLDPNRKCYWIRIGIFFFIKAGISYLDAGLGTFLKNSIHWIELNWNGFSDTFELNWMALEKSRKLNYINQNPINNSMNFCILNWNGFLDTFELNWMDLKESRKLNGISQNRKTIQWISASWTEVNWNGFWLLSELNWMAYSSALNWIEVTWIV